MLQYYDSVMAQQEVTISPALPPAGKVCRRGSWPPCRPDPHCDTQILLPGAFRIQSDCNSEVRLRLSNPINSSSSSLSPPLLRSSRSRPASPLDTFQKLKSSDNALIWLGGNFTVRLHLTRQHSEFSLKIFGNFTTFLSLLLCRI